MERNHRTIKRMVARTWLPVEEMVYWYNSSPREAQNVASIPFNLVFSYVELETQPVDATSTDVIGTKFTIGDRVVVKPKEANCMVRWRPGVITAIANAWSVEVDGVQRHVSHVRRCHGTEDE